MDQIPIQEVEFVAIEKLPIVADDSRDKINELVDAVNGLIQKLPAPVDDSRDKINELVDAVNRLMAVAPAEDTT